MLVDLLVGVRGYAFAKIGVHASSLHLPVLLGSPHLEFMATLARGVDELFEVPM